MKKGNFSAGQAPGRGRGAKPFPPKRAFASLSLRDLLDARDAYHVHLSRMDNVVATAIGRYRIHEDDWYAKNPPDRPRSPSTPLVQEPKTLANSVVKPWSWPAVLVFVRDWESKAKLGSEAIPRALYLPDGRVIPTCVLFAPPDETLPPAISNPPQTSGLLGGGYACMREHQGVQNIGTITCLVHRDGSYYALTSRHVAGDHDEEIKAFVHGEYHPVGQTANVGVTRAPMTEVFPNWPGERTHLTLDAGLVRIDDVQDWTAQAFGIGEIDEPFDAVEESITLDLIGAPVRAFGGTSGVMEGEIQALFFRYASLGGFDYTTEVLIGPRTGATSLSPPLTRPGDSGSLWFYDPSPEATPSPDDIDETGTPDRGKRARRLIPIAMQWGGERLLLPDGSTSAFALASFLSTVCSALGVDIVRDWSTGHDEYWGKIGHFSIGWKACDHVGGPLGTLMKANQKRIGFDDATISKGKAWKVGRQGFVPLADVPDYVWINSRPTNEPIQHFADIDIYDIDGGHPLLDRCFKDKKLLSAKAWKAFFDGFAKKGVGPEEGVLPFRVWQMWEAMVDYLKNGDVKRFVAAGGAMAHYVGDASQPLHCSWLHHGRPPTTKVGGREYPYPRDSPEFQKFKKTSPAKIHSIYEETMLEVDTATALAGVDSAIGHTWKPTGAKVKSGHDAAYAIIRLMHASRARLSPEDIIDADDPTQNAPDRAEALWKNEKVRRATIQSLADSTKLLADLWTAAWASGGGAKIPKAKLRSYSEAELQKVYRDPKFCPSLSLAAMAKSGDFEP